MKVTKVMQWFGKLEEHHPIQNRGHAYKVLQQAGLTHRGPSSAQTFNKAVKMYEKAHNVNLGKSRPQLEAAAGPPLNKNATMKVERLGEDPETGLGLWRYTCRKCHAVFTEHRPAIQHGLDGCEEKEPGSDG